MSKKLYVGGLSWDTSEDALKNAFEQYGQVEEAKIITDRESGRSRGFGFVTFTDDQDAMSAIDAMNGSELDGRNLSVNEARERAPRNDNRGGGYGNHRGGW
ncbi:MAG: RNA-binding protein [Bacteroidetes bacterium]|nr:MAG: RNA-binding protein [Bacteroidota bacterium]